MKVMRGTSSNSRQRITLAPPSAAQQGPQCRAAAQRPAGCRCGAGRGNQNGGRHDNFTGPATVRRPDAHGTMRLVGRACPQTGYFSVFTFQAAGLATAAARKGLLDQLSAPARICAGKSSQRALLAVARLMTSSTWMTGRIACRPAWRP